jgi:hypothetical protein
VNWKIPQFSREGSKLFLLPLVRGMIGTSRRSPKKLPATGWRALSLQGESALHFRAVGGGTLMSPEAIQRDEAEHEPVNKLHPKLPPEIDPKLNNPDSTPGTGMLPPLGGDDTNMQPSS